MKKAGPASGVLVLWVCTLLLAQNNPVPLLNLPLMPSSAAPGTSDFMLTVNGSGFVPGSMVTWNGVSLVTNFVSGSQLTASVPASNVSAPGTASVAVVNAGPGGGTSNVGLFTIRAPFRVASFGQLTLAVAKLTSPELLVSADFDGDGRFDLAIANRLVVSIYMGNGDGTFRYSSRYYPLPPNALAVGDVNDDGNTDIVSVSYSGARVSVLLGNGDGTFQSPKNSPSPSSCQAFVMGDFNQDGKLDIAASCEYQANIMLGNGDGTFQAPVGYVTGFAGGITTGDFNRDGNLDLIVTNPQDQVVVLLVGHGDGTFENTASYHSVVSYGSVVSADFNGDGRLDLAMLFFDGVSVWLGNGDGTFEPAATYLTGLPGSLVAADVNGDGSLDVTIPRTGSAEVLLGLGDGHFHNPNQFMTGGGSGAGAASGDFNGDGLMDIATPNTDGNTVSVLMQVTAVLSQTYMAFVKIPVGKRVTSNAKLANISNQPLTISEIGVGGVDAGQFDESNNCGSSLPSGATCTITVGFAPSKFGKYRKAHVVIRDSASGVPQQIALFGLAIN